MQTKLGICFAHSGLLEDALSQLQILFQDPIETDLCLDAANALQQCKQPAEVQHLDSDCRRRLHLTCRECTSPYGRYIYCLRDLHTGDPCSTLSAYAISCYNALQFSISLRYKGQETCLQAVKLYERVGPGPLQQGGLWAKWADCYVQMNNLPGAVRIYVNVANGSPQASPVPDLSPNVSSGRDCSIEQCSLILLTP